MSYLQTFFHRLRENACSGGTVLFMAAVTKTTAILSDSPDTHKSEFYFRNRQEKVFPTSL